MRVIEKENVVPIDVDNTLLLWKEPTIWSPEKLKIEYADNYIYLTPHNYHVAILKTYLEREYHVIVWSSNGYRHASRALRALGLDGYDIQVMTKPAKHLDDNSDPGSILGPRVFEPDYLMPISIKTELLKLEVK